MVLAERNFQAIHMAECGIAIGLHPTILPGDPALHQVIGTDSGYDVTISSEGARIPINNVTDDTYPRHLLQSLRPVGTQHG